MKIPESVAYGGLRAVIWLTPVTHMVGMAIAVWAWRATRKAGYIIVAVYFLLAIFGKTFPAFLSVVSRRSKAQVALTPPQQQEYTREMIALDKRYFPVGHPVLQTILFPLGPIVLVTGLWLVARRDAKRQAGVIDPVKSA